MGSWVGVLFSFFSVPSRIICSSLLSPTPTHTSLPTCSLDPTAYFGFILAYFLAVPSLFFSVSCSSIAVLLTHTPYPPTLPSPTLLFPMCFPAPYSLHQLPPWVYWYHIAARLFHISSLLLIPFLHPPHTVTPTHPPTHTRLDYSSYVFVLDISPLFVSSCFLFILKLHRPAHW